MNGTDLYGKVTVYNKLSPEKYEAFEIFFSRIILSGLDWGDITNALKTVSVEHGKFSWSDWSNGWKTVSDEYHKKACKAELSGHTQTASLFFQKASASAHFSEFMFFDNIPAKIKMRQKVTEYFLRAIPYLARKVEKVNLEYENHALPGYFIPCGGSGICPTVILINGLDSAKEVELMAFADQFLARGMSVFMFDAPGQGELQGTAPIPVNFENVIAQAITFLEQRQDVSIDRIGVFGVSFGGYLAARAASLLSYHIQACINLSGGFDHVDFDGMNETVRKDFRFIFMQSNDQEMKDYASCFLTLKDIAPIECPLLCIHGTNDTIIPISSCQKMMEWAAGSKELLVYEGERHVCTNYFGDFIPKFCDWMAERLDDAGKNGVIATQTRFAAQSGFVG